MRPILLVIFTVVFGANAGEFKSLPQAHAHNDYEHERPLLDALEQGFCSVEADIHLANGVILVGHDPEDLRAGRTLEKLYLAPLSERVAKNGGRVHKGGPPMILLVDIKTEAEASYSALRPLLQKYESMLTRFVGEQIRTNAVTVILSGNRPRETLLAEKDRFAAFDGRLADLGKNLPLSFMPLVSDNFRSHFTWSGDGEMDPEELKKIQSIVDRTHQEGRIIRFWATPDSINAWRLLKAAKVDLINTDDLRGLAAYLRAD